MPDPLPPVAIVGGTGPLGRGLAVRWARAGVAVVVGSRQVERAEALAAELTGCSGPDARPIGGATNAEAVARAAIVVVAVPYEAQAELARQLAPIVAGRTLIATAVPMTFADGVPLPLAVPAGSAAAELAALCPAARVVAALHTVSARHLADDRAALAEDVLVTGDDPEARAAAAELIARIRGLRAVDAGPLVGAAATERLTPILLALNRRHRVQLGLRLAGLPDPAGAAPALSDRGSGSGRSG